MPARKLRLDPQLKLIEAHHPHCPPRPDRDPRLKLLDVDGRILTPTPQALRETLIASRKPDIRHFASSPLRKRDSLEAVAGHIEAHGVCAGPPSR